MANISDKTRDFVDGRLSDAAQQIQSESLTNPEVPMDFNRALLIVDECRAKVRATADIDEIATHLRATERVLEHLCTGPTKACIASALHHIDKAIQGETY